MSETIVSGYTITHQSATEDSVIDVNFARSERGSIDISLEREMSTSNVHATHFNITVSEGSGYLEQSTNTNIPVEVIVALLRNQGYTVEEPR